MTPITPENLKREGFRLILRENVSYYKKEIIQVIYTGLGWQICDIDGNVGNTYVMTIEEIYHELSREMRNY